MDYSMIETISVIGGRGKGGDPDAVGRVDFAMGDVVSVVGSTGSGKTTLINDIELFADANTPSLRRVLINGAPVPAEYRNDPSRHPIALITQHTTFLSDMPVEDFLATHARIRTGARAQIEQMVERTLAFADQLTGEPVPSRARMTELSGGQTRSLLIADATIICATPIVLLDEVENAGIHRTRAIELLRQERKIFVFVTHDPRIALLSDYRLVMRNGTMSQLLRTDDQERALLARVTKLDDFLARLREGMRRGQRLTAQLAEAQLLGAEL